MESALEMDSIELSRVPHRLVRHYEQTANERTLSASLFEAALRQICTGIPLTGLNTFIFEIAVCHNTY